MNETYTGERSSSAYTVSHRTQPAVAMTVRRLVRTGMGLVLTQLVLAGNSSANTAGDVTLRVDQYVQIKPFEGESSVRARTIQILSDTAEQTDRDPSKVVIRSSIERINPETRTIQVLGRSFRVDESTRAPSDLRTVTDLKPGQWVKVTVQPDDAGVWFVQRIKTDQIDRRTKIEGIVTGVWPASGWPDSISLSGLNVRTPDNTAIFDHEPTASDRLFSKIVNARDPRRSGPWLARDWFWSRGRLGVVQRIENDFSIGDSARDHYREAEPQLKLDFTVKGPAGIYGLLKLRTRNTFVLNNAPLHKKQHETAIQLYEGYVLWRDVFSMPFAIQAGRQDFDEYREWLFDDQLDAIRFHVYPMYPIVAEAAYIHSLDNSPDNKFRTLKDYLIHVHGRIFPDAEVAVYRLWRTDTDLRGREPIWTGLRYRGAHWGLHPWLDAAWIRGWDKGRRFKADALDFGVTAVRPVGGLEFSVTVAHAHGSGNSDNPKSSFVDKEFQQTGYEDNTGSFNGVVSLQYYGEVFDPELSNLDILTVGAGCKLSAHTSTEVVYHRYRQAEYSSGVGRELAATDLTMFDYGGRGIDPNNGRPARTLFAYRDVGWEIDVVTGATGVLGAFDLKWVMGFFAPGDALSPPFWEQFPFKPKKRNVFLNQLSLEWHF